MATLLEEILGVRSILGNPLPQSPSPDEIIEELEAVYQDVTNTANNTGNAWSTDSLTITTVAGQRVYELDPAKVANFSKALIVTTVPPDTSTPEYVLEFTEQEHLPQEWAWLSQNQGSLYWTSHSSQLIAFYREMTATGEKTYCEMRPTPNSAQDYKVLYQVGTWWSLVNNAATPTEYVLPHKPYKFHFRAIAANRLLPKTRWSYGDDTMKKKEIAAMLDRRIAENKDSFEDYIATLDNADVTWLDSYADIVDPYLYPIRYR